MSSDAGETSNNAIQHSLSRLAQLLSGERVDRKQTRRVLADVVSHGERVGFTASEASLTLRIALRGGPAHRTILPNVASTLIRCIRPAAEHLFGPSIVLLVLNALGGAVDTGADVTGLDVADDELDDDSIVGSDRTFPTSFPAVEGQSRRKFVEVHLQVLALRLLLQLYDPPSIVMWANQMTGDPSAHIRAANLPSSFFTSQARQTLDRCYGVLFHYLDYETIRPHLCHLLCLITRRKHVPHYRIAKILSLRARLPLDPAINAVLRTYASFYPDMLFSGTTTDRLTNAQVAGDRTHGFRYPSIPWLISVYSIWKQPRPAQDRGEAGRGRLRRQSRQQSGSRRQGTSQLLPFLTPPPSVLLTEESTLAVFELTSSRELGYRFDKVRMPDQYASALSHRTTSIALLSRQTNRYIGPVYARIHEWAYNAMSDQMSLPMLVMQGSLPFQRTTKAHEASAALMESLAAFADRVGCCDERLQTRLYRILQGKSWDQLRECERTAFLQLLEYFTPPAIASIFKANVLDQLTKVLGRAAEKDVTNILRALTRMLSNWASRDWQSIFRRLEAEDGAYWGSMPLLRDAEYAETIATTVTCVAQMADDALCKRPDSVSLIHVCLSLHEVILSEALVGLHDLLLPPTFTLYLPCFSQSGAIMALSRQFGIVHSVRLLHQEYMAAKADGFADDSIALDGLPVPLALSERRLAFFAEESSDRINDCVILLLDLVWRNNGFVSVEAGNVDIGLPLDFFASLTKRCRSRGDELQQIGSASHSATLGILMEAYANDLARQRGAEAPVLHGPLTPAKLKLARRVNFPVISHRDFRDSFLTWLAGQGAKGISELLNATITRFIRGLEIDQSTVFS